VNGPAAAAARDAVFLSYSHDDQDWRLKFTQLLAPLLRNQRLELWDDTYILPGDDWRRNIDDGVRRAGTALLLVTGSYLASRFIMEEELPALIEHGVRLVPVLAGDCLWDQEPLLASVQWAHDPGRDGSLAAADPREVNRRIVRMCYKLLEALPAAGKPPQAATPASAWIAPIDEAAALPPGPAGQLHGVPALPAEYLERDELGGLRTSLLGAAVRAVGVTGDVHALGLHGQGGIGKTVLAAAAASDPVIRAHFPDGVFWVTAGEQPDLVRLQAGLLARLGVPAATLRSATEGVSLLRQVLAGRQVLLVVDDIWSAAAAEAFSVTGPRGRVLYTTRDPVTLAAVHAAAEQVGVLPPAVAGQLLARITGTPAGALPQAEVTRVLAATGRVALAVALVGAAVRSGKSWPEAAGELDRGGDTFLDHPYANIFKAMQVATGALEPGLALAYYSLAVYPPDARIPVAAVSRYWGRLRGSSPGQALADLQALASRELLILDRGEITFHDLQHSYLLLQADVLALRHADLLASYSALLPAADASWWHLPAGEPYIWDHLLHHLHGAGDRAGAARTLTDLAYLAKRIALGGPHAAETDLAEACGLLPGDPRISWLRRWLAQHAHLFAGLANPADAAVTIAGWLVGPPAGIDHRQLDPLLPPLYLAPRWGLPGIPPALTRVLEGHARAVTAVAFSPDGRRLASADNTTVRLWDLPAGQCTATFEGRASAMAFSPDGRLLAAALPNGMVRLWDLATGQVAAAYQGAGTGALAFAPDGRHLATAGWNKVQLWDLAAGTAQTTVTGPSSRAGRKAFSPDGRRLADAGEDATVLLWDLAASQCTAVLPGHTPSVDAVAFSPDGRRLATADSTVVQLWDPAAGQRTAVLTPPPGTVWAVAFSPDGRLLATASGDDGTVRLWDAAAGQRTAVLTGHTGEVYAVAFSPDGRQLASTGSDRTVRLWDPALGAPAATAASQGHTGQVTAVTCTPDGQRLASAGGYDGTVRLWDAATGQCTRVLTGYDRAVFDVAFSPDGRLLASAGGGDGTVLWDLATEQCTVMPDPDGSVEGVAFSPGGRQLASAGVYHRTVRLWDAATGQCTATLEGPHGPVEGVAFSPGGRQLAAAIGAGHSPGGKGAIWLWDPATGRPAWVSEGHQGSVLKVAFSPGGRLLATAASDGTVLLWDAATGQRTSSLGGHAAEVRGIAFSPGGRQLATAGYEGIVRLWDVRTQVMIAQLKLGAPAGALTWGQHGITVAVHADVWQLAVIARAAGT
jgi:WD40 repeat protein